MVTLYHKNPCTGGHEIYNFEGSFLGHYYNTLGLSGQCLGVEKNGFKENNVFSLYNLNGHASALEPLPRGS